MKKSNMRAANDLARLHICTVAPEPLLITLKRRGVNEGPGQIVYTCTSSCGLGTYRKRPGEPANSHSLARAFADCTKKDVDVHVI